METIAQGIAYLTGLGAFLTVVMWFPNKHNSLSDFFIFVVPFSLSALYLLIH